MTIDKEEGDKIIRNSKLPYGSSHGSDFQYISLYSQDELPIVTTKEYDVAENIAKKHGLIIINQDFGEGEGMHPQYKTVFAAICRQLNEAQTAEVRIETAEKELDDQLKELWVETIPGR